MKKTKADRYRGITRISKGRYRVRARAIDPRTGKEREKDRIIEAKTTAEAAAKRDALADEIREGTKQPTREKLRDFAKSWLKTKRKTVRKSTAERYQEAVGHIVADLGDIFVDALRPRDVEGWRDALTESYEASTVNGWLRVFRAIGKRAVRDLGVADPTAGVSALSEKPTERATLEAAELGALLEHVRVNDPHHYPLLLILSTTGMRWGEATALRWEDIDEAAGVIRVVRAHRRGDIGSTKTGRPRVFPLIDEVREAFRAHRRWCLEKQRPGFAEGWCFATHGRDGGFALRTPSSWGKALPRWLKAIGCRKHITPHGLRYTWVDLSRLAGVDPTTRRALVGHAGDRIHDRYSTVGQQEAARAIGSIVGLTEAGEKAGERGF